MKVGLEFDGEVKDEGRFGDPATVLRAEKHRHDALVSAGWWVVRVDRSTATDQGALAPLLARAHASRSPA